MDPVVHFEMPAEDKKRMAEFYTKAFGWKTEMTSPEMGEYVLVTTTETDENRMPKNPGSINGGFYQKTDDPVSQYPSVVISVNDVKESVRKVEDAGGQILWREETGKFDDIPGVGLYASFKDTEGNRVGMLQPTRRN
jgi:predicted enzyme related to lactoylglutathione lyase